MKFKEVQARDIIALWTITLCFIGKFMGLDGALSILTAGIIGFYFSKRVYEEKMRK